MKRTVLTILGIVLAGLVLGWVIRWVDRGGWPTSEATGEQLPVHIEYVKPADGEAVEKADGFCVHFNYEAGGGMADNPEKDMRYFLDGMEVTDHVEDIVKLEYGYPAPVGEPCYTRSKPLGQGWHTVKIQYEDRYDKEYEYTWRFLVRGVEGERN